MILSTQFSRQNRLNQSWTNGANNHHHHNHTSSLPRKSAPEHRAPERPQPNGRSSTLNRLDLLKQRQQQRAITSQASSVNGNFIRRNVSSLGHYPTTAYDRDQTNSSFRSETPANLQIYAPASIASPSEYTCKNRTLVNGISRPVANGYNQNNHYAATSVHSVPIQKATASPSNGSRSGRESALGSLFGTIRRKATSRWSSSSGFSSDPNSSKARQRSLSSLSGRHKANVGYSAPPVSQSKSQNEPIYANGYLASIPVESKDENRDKSKPLGPEEIYAEGAHAIDSNAIPRLIEVELLQDPEQWAEGETRTLIEEQSRVGDNFQQLQAILVNWINDELSDQRIIVRDLREDLYDGQILCKLVERLQRVRLDIVEVTQNEQAQKFKLHTVLMTLNKILSLQARWAKIRWSVEGIHQKNLIEIIHLLVSLAKYYRAPIKLPPNVVVIASTYQKNSYGQLTKRSHREQLTSESTESLEDLKRRAEPSQRLYQQNANSIVGRDAFDALVEQAPEKLGIVTQTLVKFCNRHLEKINITAGQTLDTEQFSDGLLFVFLISSLEGYFVPLGQLFTTIKRYEMKPAYQETSLDTLPFIDANNNDLDPTHQGLETAIEPSSFINTQPIEKLHNVNLALQLMEEAGLSELRQQVRAEDLVNGNLKAVLRVLYALFSRYKHV